MTAEVRSQKSEVRRKWTVHSEQWTVAGFTRTVRSLFPIHYSLFTALLLFTVHCPLSTAIAATHVTATYDLGTSPQVMTTVSGQPQYGLVFAQRNKTVTYSSVEYNPSVVKGYLNAGGQLNDGAGNLWLDLIPNLGATPADSYYVVTFNIQGRVHAEIWVLPDVASVSAEAVRQSQPPSSSKASCRRANRSVPATSARSSLPNGLPPKAAIRCRSSGYAGRIIATWRCAATT